MNTKLLDSNKFFEDLNASKVEEEFQTVLQLVYEANQGNPSVLAKASKMEHIILQWTFLRDVIPPLHENIQSIWFRLICRSAIVANAASGCERANSEYSLFKSKLSSSIILPNTLCR